MKKLHLGFTLSEILVALAIVGVISALAISQVSLQVQKDRAGITLGHAVEQIESGCKSMIMTANANLDGMSFAESLDALTEHDLFPNLNSDTLLSQSNPGLWKSFMGYRSNIPAGMHFGPGRRPEEWYIFNKFDAKAQITSNGDDTYTVIILAGGDIDGAKAVRRQMGKNLFEFTLQPSCKMVPYGLNSDDHYTVNCTDNHITDGRACAARVVADGFKIKYNF